MLKKFTALSLTAVIAAAIFCSCGNNKPAESSAPAKEENYSSVETITDASSEIFSSENENSSKENETSSQKQQDDVSSKNENNDTSSEKENVNTSSKEDQSSNSSKEEQTSTSSRRPTVQRPTGQTSSGSVKVNVDPSSAIGLGMYHFNPSWTKSYGKEEADHFKEFDDVLSAGFFNTVIAGAGWLLRDEFWDAIIKNDATVWIHYYGYYNSKKETPEAYKARIKATLDQVKAIPERWERLNGFHYEENIWRGQTNDDFLFETKTNYQMYGKRNFCVFATGEFTGVEGNELELGTGAESMQKVLPYAMEYLTDVGFDNYSVDVREGAPNGGFIERNKVEFPHIKDGRDYYEAVGDLLLRLTGHPANIWFFPTSYDNYLWGGLNGIKFADEDYCIAHLEFFHDLLDKYEHKGGLFCYTYAKFGGTPGFQDHLALEAPPGSDEFYLVAPEGKKWRRYTKLMQQYTAEFKTRKGNLVYTIK